MVAARVVVPVLDTADSDAILRPWITHPPSRPIRLRAMRPALVLVVAVLALVSSSDTSKGAWPPCAPAAEGGGGPCYAEMYQWKTASFLVQGQYWVFANWSYESYIWYYAWPRSGYEVELYSISHRMQTQLSWPSGSWQTSFATAFWGNLTYTPWCTNTSNPCLLGGLGSGPNTWYPREFHFYRDSVWGSGSVYCDYNCRLRVNATLYPWEWVSSASGHTATDNCRRPWWEGTRNC